VPPQPLSVTALGNQILDLELADPAKLPLLVGTLLDALLTPIIGAQIQASDPATGEVVSTVAWSDATGAFSLRLRKSLPASIRVTAMPAAMAALPNLVVNVATSGIGPTLPLTVALQLPALPTATHVVYKVVGQSASGVQTPVVAASCTFYADVSDPGASNGAKAYYVTTATSDATGAAAVDLIPMANGNRTYQIVVSPDPTSGFSATTMSVDVGPHGGFGPAIVLPLRAVISGRALDPTGQPLANATVVPAAAALTVAPALDLWGASGAATQPKLASAISDTDGRFTLHVDVSNGVYDLDLVPPPETMLPRLWLSTQVTGSTDVGNVTVPRGVIEQGLVVSAGQPVIGADVRIYTVPPNDNTCGGNSNPTCLAPARLRAEGTTRSDGTVPIILPSAPAN
jgi:hypothetical protein